jgi:hypothetical protein
MRSERASANGCKQDHRAHPADDISEHDSDVLTSHPIAIIVLMQSSGKYAIHSRMLRSERLTSSSARASIDKTASDVSDEPSTKYRCRA